MSHRLLFALAASLAACATLVSGAAADRGQGHGQVYTYAGELLSTPGANASSVSVQVETGNRPALRSLINASQSEVFSIASGTEILVYANGVPHVGSSGDLQAGDFVNLRIRAAGGSSLQEIESQPAAVVSKTGAPHAGLPLWLFSGTVAGPQSGGRISLHVGSGNWKALQGMLGQSLDQAFAYDEGTIFLLWQGRVPTVIDPSQLKAGDRITVRVRAPRTDSLAQVEATPAAHVGDHEPATPAED